MLHPVVTTRSRVILMAAKKRDLSSGALAKEAGVNVETIRYYDNIGLMPELSWAQ